MRKLGTTSKAFKNNVEAVLTGQGFGAVRLGTKMATQQPWKSKKPTASTDSQLIAYEKVHCDVNMLWNIYAFRGRRSPG